MENNSLIKQSYINSNEYENTTSNYQNQKNNINYPKDYIEFPNTKYITLEYLKTLDEKTLIRIAGGYDEERINKSQGIQYPDGRYIVDDYIESVIYTKNEVIQILKELDKIELGLNHKWSQFKKMLYIYDALKREIMYDPKGTEKESKEIRSLMGLISKKTVCAGFSLIFKELMDRNGIECEYVRGSINQYGNGGHTWNIVTIDGKKYPIDLTGEVHNVILGNITTIEGLCQSISDFCLQHYPAWTEKTQDYEKTLSQIDYQQAKEVYSQLGMNALKTYYSTTYTINVKGKTFVVSQIDDIKIGEEVYYRYYYVEISPSKTQITPLLVYSKDNVMEFFHDKIYEKPNRNEYSSEEEYINALKTHEENCKIKDMLYNKILFSRENIVDSIIKNTSYIGSIVVNNNEDDSKYISSHKEIIKPIELTTQFKTTNKVYVRKNNTKIIIQENRENPIKINGIELWCYDIFELVEENNKYILKRNEIITEHNILKEKNHINIDEFLSRQRIDVNSIINSGYMGHFDQYGSIVYNETLLQKFSNQKNIKQILGQTLIETAKKTK